MVTFMLPLIEMFFFINNLVQGCSNSSDIDVIVHGLAQDCDNPSANTLEFPQSCT